MKSFAKKRGRFREKGAALIVVVTILLILTLLGVTLLNKSQNEYTLSYNRIYAEHATELATAGVNLFLNKLKDPAIRNALINDQKLQNLFSSNPIRAEVEFRSNQRNVPHKGFARDAFLPTANLGANQLPPVFGEFEIIPLDTPKADPTQKASAGMGIGIGPTASRRCDYVLTLVAKGKVVDPRFGGNDARSTIAEKKYRIQIKLSGMPCS